MIDGFAGPGGWDVAARALGVDPLGIELDDAACATRAAAGLRTLQADVSALDPQQFAPVRGLIFSPPCQAFSMAGSGEGRAALDAYLRAIRKLAAEGWIDREALDKACQDERAHLVLEPLRWALALKPRWVACEQVEPVLPLWEATARGLREHGYRTWTGMLSAEQYGVPQTRRRAILLASLDGEVQRPAPSATASWWACRSRRAGSRRACMMMTLGGARCLIRSRGRGRWAWCASGSAATLWVSNSTRSMRRWRAGGSLRRVRSGARRGSRADDAQLPLL